MKIGINATCFNNRPSGARQRFIGLYGTLFKKLPSVEFTIYEPRDCNIYEWFPAADNIKYIKTIIPSEGRVKKFIYSLIFWHKELRIKKYDIFEGSHLPFFKLKNAYNIITIHDLRDLQPNANIIIKILYKITMNIAMSNVQHVITVSEIVKNELLQIYPNKKISVIYNGLNSQEKISINLENKINFQDKYQLKENFLLTVGHFEKRKNYDNLIKALYILKKQDESYKLVIIGNDSGEMNNIKKLIIIKNLQNNIIIINGLTDLEVKCAFNLCSAFIFPSLYEGFGIPVVEAMKAERPLILSDIPVFREITEEKLFYFNAKDPNSIVYYIRKIMNDENLKNKIINYGKIRFKDFNYEELAVKQMNIYFKIK